MIISDKIKLVKKILIYYFLLIFSAVIFLAPGVVDSQDGFQYLAVARNIYYKGEPVAPPNEYITDERNNIPMSLYTGKNGKTYSPTGLGYSLALLPAVAITDVVYKIYHITPPVHFPLESDWLILMLANFTNALFGAGLAVILFLYFLEIKLSPKHALLMSLVGFFGTNLLIYARSVTAHMMFVCFLTLSFLLLKKYANSKKRIYLVWSGIAYGIVMITYNQTFLLPVIPYIIYYLLLLKPKICIASLKQTSSDVVYFLAATLPFVLTYLWFENTRAYPKINFATPAGFVFYVKDTFSNFPFSVFIEGLFGQLFSPGRSIFLYSPLLLIIIFFWHKIKASVKPELIMFLVLSIIYVFFYASQYSVGAPDQGIAALWHGESSWGPRYLLPLIPFGMLIVGYIYQSISKGAKLFIFYPLLAFGLYVGTLGIVMPNQIKFYNLDGHFYINGTEYTPYVYNNLLPRYSPIFMMSKNLIKLAQSLPKTLDHGFYNVRFYDGIDFPFNVGPERWRVIEGQGHIKFDNNKKEPVKNMIFGMINHPLKDSSSSAQIQFFLNNQKILEKPVVLVKAERENIDVPIPEKYLKEKDNQLLIDVSFDQPNILKDKKQILGIIALWIDNKQINMESLDFPHVSPLGPIITGKAYQTYGNLNQNPWRFWDIHTQIYERTPDFWWIKPLYYWDFPKPLFLIAFLINIGMLMVSARKVFLMRKTFKVQ